MIKLCACALLAATLPLAVCAQEQVGARRGLVLEGQIARVVVDLGGGSIAEFRFKEGGLNPLSWATPQPADESAQGFGHFLCLDRWGPPSAAEGAKGMPYHGEASHVQWKVTRQPLMRQGALEAELKAVLPLAGLRVKRTIRLSADQAVMRVTEEVTNVRPIGRIYNMVQHPTVGPPFLDESTLVDCNGVKGFAQGGSLPTPEEPSFSWPAALASNGGVVDMRRLRDDPNPNVVSYVIDEARGWVTATAPRAGLLLGYLWKTGDYPWVSLWRDVHDGQPAARGLEFGTTGLHQPFPILVQKGRIWGHPLFDYLDAGESKTRSYTAFLVKVRPEFRGVASIQVQAGKLVITERGGSEILVDGGGVLAE